MSEPHFGQSPTATLVVLVPTVLLAIVNNLFWVSNFENALLFVVQQFILGYAVIVLFLLTRWVWTPLQFYHPILIIAVAWFLRDSLAQTGVALSFMIVSQIFFNLRKHLGNQLRIWHLVLVLAGIGGVCFMSTTLQVGHARQSFVIAGCASVAPFAVFLWVIYRFGWSFDTTFFVSQKEAQ
ncbi:hypothetical protein [uncultured Roseobacter sp.]|uniref:hypothetical protein n=1 Tax=uncultured Roseobacter sp. TaxID=114847 RepID=UPI0026323F4D|nr:hypothetical protein [uncultured Roseobacter sp.]